MTQLSASRLATLTLGLVLAACGTSPVPQAREPDRELLVVMRDDFTYNPADIEVTAGEIISFKVANKGELRHEFLIGTVEQHEDHEKQMAEGNEHGAHESNLEGVVVDLGKEKTFTFIVPSGVNLLFGCHEPGHYEKGMKGSMRYRG